mmetsp:Transcript_22062/g.47028  ORF Transcript_22062/g.47028 Transcript_22062/m.47028 type:complete len:397 (+) Transcript_22062:201-1391(+)
MSDDASSELTLRSLLLEDVPNLAFLDFSSGPSGEAVRPKIDLAGNLERGQVLRSNLLDLLGRWRRHARSCHHSNCHNFAEVFMRHPDGSDFQNIRMFEYGCFHLRTRDVLAASDDQILGAVDYVEQTVFVCHTEVSSAEPQEALFIDVEDLVRFVGLAVVLLHDHCSVKADFPDLPRPDLLVVDVQNADLQVKLRNPSRSRTQGKDVSRHSAADHVRLGETVSSAGLGCLDLVVDSLDHWRREGRSPAADNLERGGVVLVKVFVVRDVVSHGRDSNQCLDFLVLNDLQGALGVPLAHRAELGPASQSAQKPRVGPSSMEEWRAEQKYWLVGTLPNCCCLEDSVSVDGSQDAPMRAGDALGVAGGAGGVHQHGSVVLANRARLECRQAAPTRQKVLE